MGPSVFVGVEFLQVRAFHLHRRTPTNTAGIGLVGVPVGVWRWPRGGLPQSALSPDGGCIWTLSSTWP